jgi:hypothetical protein
MANLIDQSDIETRIGVRTVRKLTADDGGPDADAAVVAAACDFASRRGEGILRSAFGSATVIAELVQADSSVKNAIVEIACGWLGGRHAANLDKDGKVPYDGWQTRAEEYLTEIADAKRRAIGEDTAGQNQKLSASTVPSSRTLHYLSTENDPNGPGGF